MRILITGANGFVGRTLVARLCDSKTLGVPLTLGTEDRISLIDMHFDAPSSDPRVTQFEGSFGDARVLQTAISDGADIVFHLASVPGGSAERDYALGRRVNLDATAALFDFLHTDRDSAVLAPRVVFASTVAVYGAQLPAAVDDSTPLRPTMSYGTQKLIGELLLNDLSRRGLLDGVSLRLPGIVARPPEPSGLLSAFMSEIFWALATGRRFRCPVSPHATAWWMSVQCCVDNLIHAATLERNVLSTERAFALPVLRVTIAELVEALAGLYGDDRRQLIEYAPEESLEAAFGRYPPLETGRASSLGFRHDGDTATLIRRAMATGT